jgi:hypothetical protein
MDKTHYPICDGIITQAWLTISPFRSQYLSIPLYQERIHLKCVSRSSVPTQDRHHVAPATKIRHTVFVETQGHHSISGIKGLFDAVSVMNVDIDIHDPLVVSQQFQDSQYDICFKEEFTPSVSASRHLTRSSRGH